MILNTYRETYKGLDKVYRFTEEQQYLLSVWAQCLLDSNWASTMYFTTSDYPDADEVRKIIAFAKSKKIKVQTTRSTVKGQDWYGKMFFDIPFGVSHRAELEALTLAGTGKN